MGDERTVGFTEQGSVAVQPSRAHSTVLLIWRRRAVGYAPPREFEEVLGKRRMTLQQVGDTAERWLIWFQGLDGTASHEEQLDFFSDIEKGLGAEPALRAAAPTDGQSLQDVEDA